MNGLTYWRSFWILDLRLIVLNHLENMKSETMKLKSSKSTLKVIRDTGYRIYGKELYESLPRIRKAMSVGRSPDNIVKRI